MTNTYFKRRSINLDDTSFNRGRFLAEQKAISLSALLRIFINEAFDHHTELQQQRDSSRSRS
jgi:hypothetical protein